MSLVIDLIGQLNCHVTGCKTRKSDDEFLKLWI